MDRTLGAAVLDRSPLEKQDFRARAVPHWLSCWGSGFLFGEASVLPCWVCSHDSLLWRGPLLGSLSDGSS